MNDESLPAEHLLALIPSILTATPARLAALAGSVPDHRFRARPVAGEWSPYQVVLHLIDTESLVFPFRIRAILDGATTIPSVDQDAMAWDESVPTADLVGRFGELRTDTLALLSSLSPDDVEREIEHAEYGRVTMGQMLHYYPAHDLAHLIQIERALMQPFLPGAGAWAENVAGFRMR